MNVVRPNRSRRAVVLFVALLGLLWARPGAAQSQGFDKAAFSIQTFRPALDSYGLVTLNGTTMLEHLDFAIELSGSWAWQPLTLQLDAGQPAPGGGTAQGVRRFSADHVYTPQFQAVLGLYRRVELGLTLPVSILLGHRAGCDAMGGGCSSPGRGGDLSFSKGVVADPGLHLKIGVLNNARYAVGMALLASVYLPISHWAGVGSSNYLLGEDQVTLRPQLALDREWLSSRRLRTVINLGALVRFGSRSFTDSGQPQAAAPALCAPADSASAQPPACGTGLTRGTGSQFTYGLGALFAVVKDRFDVMGELAGAASGNANDHALEGAVALKLHITPNAYFLAGLSGGVIPDQTASPRLRVFGGFHFEPRGRDRDHDGVRDSADRCPDEPEDMDDFEDEDGCPELDNDGDGVPDAKDRCPNAPETANGFEDEDGCPDEAPEQKPLRPKTGDRDGDGIPDDQDQCPDDPEDKDGFQDENGCPDPDNDDDGVLDTFDKCPNEKESVNGYQDDDGCPDKPPRALVNLTADNIEVLDKIFFEPTTPVIKAQSHPVLDAVASVLRHSPQIKLVEIQGHADERGNDKTNLRLTQERANAIEKYLVAKGVAPTRLQAKGYGATKPLCRDWSEECWAKNRRVDFVILKRGDAVEQSAPAPTP